MQNWKLAAAIIPLFFVAYQTLSKTLPKGTSVILVTTYASFISAFFILIVHLLTSQNKSLSLTMHSFLLAIAIGILISIGNFLIIRTFSLNAPQTGFYAIFNALYVIYGVVIGLILWHEKLNGIQMIGILFSIMGIVMVAYFK